MMRLIGVVYSFSLKGITPNAYEQTAANRMSEHHGGIVMLDIVRVVL
jgi:hypothetical protein